jgi:hypothetical protein
MHQPGMQTFNQEAQQFPFNYNQPLPPQNGGLDNHYYRPRGGIPLPPTAGTANPPNSNQNPVTSSEMYPYANQQHAQNPYLNQQQSTPFYPPGAQNGAQPGQNFYPSATQPPAHGFIQPNIPLSTSPIDMPNGQNSILVGTTHRGHVGAQLERNTNQAYNNASNTQNSSNKRHKPSQDDDDDDDYEDEGQDDVTEHPANGRTLRA